MAKKKPSPLDADLSLDYDGMKVRLKKRQLSVTMDTPSIKLDLKMDGHKLNEFDFMAAGTMFRQLADHLGEFAPPNDIKSKIRPIVVKPTPKKARRARA
jgi:hypothetical protein